MMSQRDNFAVGFLAGAIVGGFVGGAIGAAVGSRRGKGSERENLLGTRKGEALDSEESIEMARRTLEDKIAQLNLAIDDVRQQLGAVNSSHSE
jgi:outer membrane lipoprotein SlyB